jgi:hypothetical protein
LGGVRRILWIVPRIEYNLKLMRKQPKIESCLRFSLQAQHPPYLPLATLVSALGVTAFANCEEAEEAGGLVSLWGRDGAAVVLPSRMFAEGEAARLVAHVRARIRRARTS